MNVIWCEISCGRCGAAIGDYYSPDWIKKLKAMSKDWTHDDNYRVLCPQCRKELKKMKPSFHEEEDTFMKNEIYSVAYNDKYNNGFSKIEPWIISDFGNDLKKCKIKANELIRQWCKNVTIFKCNKLPEIVTWDYVKSHQI